MKLERKTIYQESTALIENAIDGLPHNYKIVYVLKQVSRMEIAEIAHVLDLSESEVRAIFLKAQQMIEEMLLHRARTEQVFKFGDHRSERLCKKVMNRIHEIQTER